MKEKLEMDLEAMLKEHELFENPETEKQRHILQAAEKVFGEKGYDAAPTAEIAREAGVTERTLFKHFRTKSALLKRVVFAFAVKTLLPLQIKKVNAMTQAPHESFEDLMKTIARDRLDTLRTHGKGAKIVFLEAIQNEPFRDQFKTIWREQVWSGLIGAIQRLQDEGKVRKDLPAEKIARAMVLTTAGYVFFRTFLVPKENWEDEKEIDSLAKILSEGLASKK